MAPGTLGRLCAAAGVNVVHFSTDYVFDGSGSIPYVEDSPPNPINHYGASKLAGERGLMESGAEFLLIRTQWLYGSTGRSFPATMWERAKTGTETRVVNDQHGRPTSAASVARALWQLIDAGADGVYHVANRGVATWYEVAERIFTAFGVQELVTPCTTADFPTPAARPAYSVLDTGKLEREAGIWLPHWTDALEDWTASREPGTGNREPVTGNR
jgi:dTDP-4-dehydrorhamnose reductase